MIPYKRVLVISNNCFSQSNSNGRTLGNLFHGWPKENLAQMCVIAQDPNWELCDNYFCIEDKTMLKAFLSCKKANGYQVERKLTKGAENKSYTKRANLGKKTMSKMFLREVVWAFNRWNSKQFNQWIDRFNPDAVLFQFGDSVFMIKIAIAIAQSRNIPLIIYNTEGYYFFSDSWYHPSVFDYILFPPYKSFYRKWVKRLMGKACHSIYLNDELCRDYDFTFGKKSSVIYNSSSIAAGSPPTFDLNNLRVSYLGSLGHERDKALIQVGESLQKINTSYYVDIYGSANDEMKKRFEQASGVRFHGLVSYDQVMKITQESDILLLVEPIENHNEHLKYGFSGKIADSITSGKCFVVYAPKDISCARYIESTGSGWIADNKEELYNVFCEIINNPIKRNKILTRAEEVAKENHNFEKNAHRFQEILIKTIG